MAETPRDAEIQALEVLIAALEPLDDDARARVLEYTLRRLAMRELPVGVPAETPHAKDLATLPPPIASSGQVVDIRTLRAEKSPGTAIEMAAIVAYYLSEAAPEEQRKETVTTADIERYFKQAQYPLPSRIGNTLTNAAAAGYFDSAARGAYKLNPVGYNLVTQNLPRGSAQNPQRAATRKRATTSAASASKAGSAKKKRAG
jgi:hypothetical protein